MDFPHYQLFFYMPYLFAFSDLHITLQRFSEISVQIFHLYWKQKVQHRILHI